MKKIELTQGQVVLVDDEDYEWLSQYKWYAYYSKTTQSYYAQRTDRSNGNQYSQKMSRYIMGCVKGDDNHVDHINHDTLDNRKQNLRITSRSGNMRNRKKSSKDSTSLYKGVSWSNRNRKWQAQIKRPNCKSQHIGYFTDELEAAKAYDAEAKILYKDHACLNNVTDSSPRSDFTPPTHTPPTFSSKYKGVSYNKKYNKWRAYFTYNKKQKHIGNYDTEIDAYVARKKYLETLTNERP